jgi:arylsulfatase A-like enzyme
MHLLGYDRETTRNLDGLARKGLIFSQAMATAPWTVPSVTSILTSTYPPMYGGYLSPRGRVTIAEILKAKQYRTAAFVYGWLPFVSGYRNGFDLFQSDLDPEDGVASEHGFELATKKAKSGVRRLVGGQSCAWRLLEDINNLARAFRDHAANRRFAHTSRSFTERGLRWLSRIEDDRPFFLWIHYPDSHEPYYLYPEGTDASLFQIWHVNRKAMHGIDYRPPFKLRLTRKDIQMLIDLYDTSIEYVDAEVGLLLEGMARMGLLDDTVFIVTGDHGQQFMEHGDFGHPPYLYDELLRVPLLFAGPRVDSGKVVRELVSLLDIAPTALHLLNIRSPSQFLGQDIMKEQRKYVIAEEFLERADMARYVRSMTDPIADYGKRRTAYRTAEWKYVYKEAGGHELYNLSHDPQEKRNVIGSEPEIAKTLGSRVSDHIAIEAMTDMIAERRRIAERIKGLTLNA